MGTDQIIVLALSAVLFVALFVQSIFLLNGKGASLIAGYNTLPKAEQEKYNKVALCKFVGVMLLFLNIFIIGMTVSIALRQLIPAITCGVMFMLTVLFTVFWVNYSSRFKKTEPQPAPSP